MLSGTQNGGPTSVADARAEVALADDDACALQGLRAATLQDLRVEWRRTFRRHPPPGLNRSLLFGMIAYQRQADVFGDLEQKHQSFLDRIGTRIVRGREGQGRDGQGRGAFAQDEQGRGGRGGRPLVPPLPTNSMQVGTVLIREWNDRPEAVTVVEGGFLWAGAIYPTLSAVANAITGRHWNGWVFFGLKRTASRRKGEGTSSPEMMMPEKAAPATQASGVVAAPSIAPPQPPRRRGRPPKARPGIAVEAMP
jgi:hypothetical protein